MTLPRMLAAIVLLHAVPAVAGVFSYECSKLPEEAEWSVAQIYCNPQEWIDSGFLIQVVDECATSQPPSGQEFTYTRSLATLVGEPNFFVEWRVETTAPQSDIPWAGGAALSCWSFGSVNYQFRIATDLAQLVRDNTLPIVRIAVQSEVSHSYRLELVGTQSYAWFVDGQVVDTGIPEGAYPSANPGINFRAKAAFYPNTTKWGYIRYGTIPAAYSGDFDSNGVVDQFDLYFFVDCLLGPDYDASGPGCRWGDMNGDGVADGRDVQLFCRAMVGS